MANINMGEIGPPREHPMSKFARGLAEGVVSNQEMGLKREQLGIQREQVALQKQEASTRTEMLKRELANDEFTKGQKNREMTLKTLEDFSMKLNSMETEGEKQMLIDSDVGKSVNDLVKKYAPEYYDKEKKSVLVIPDADIYEKQLKKQEAMTLDKLRRGEKLTENETAFLDAIGKGGTKDTAQIMSVAVQSPKFKSLMSDLDYAETDAQKTAIQDKMNKVIEDLGRMYYQQKTRGNNRTQQLAPGDGQGGGDVMDLGF